MTQRPDMDGLGSSAPTEAPTKFFGTMIICSTMPLVVTLLLPEPYETAVMPVAAFMLVFTFFFGLALTLHWLSVAWRFLRPATNQPLRCPACHTPEQGAWTRFSVVRMAPSVYRVRCGECGERWIDRSGGRV